MTLNVLVEEDVEGCMSCLAHGILNPLGFANALGMEDQAVEVFRNPPNTEWACDMAVLPVVAVADLPILQLAEDVAALVVPAIFVRIDIVRIFL